MLTENTVNKLYEMRLTAMAKAFKDQLSDSNIFKMPFEDRFGLLVDQEWTSRKNNHLKRLIKQAKFAEPGACVEDIEYHADRNLDQTQIARLSTCNFITERHNILLLGATGSGKTVLLKFILMQCILKEYSVIISDFKGGVDYGPIWENHCTLICDNIEFITVIQGLVDELKRRFEYLRQFGHANIDDYNSKVTFAPMRRIILFVDELGECLDKSGMTKEQKETVDQITQGLNTLCRLGRAAGISCILSTQRGSADLISGQIRNNALKIVGKCDENLSLLTIGITDAAKELIYPGQFMDENGNVFQGYYADYTDLLRQRREKGTIGCYAIKCQPIHFLDEKVIEVLEDGTES